MRIIGVDPGTERSAFLILQDGQPVTWEILPNYSLLPILRGEQPRGSRLAIEWVSFYGKEIHAGSETFDTCRWTGRFEEAWGNSATCTLIARRVVRAELCGTMKAGDKEVRAVLIDRYGGKEKAIGKKAAPGPLFGVASHVWSSLAVATVYADRQAKIAAIPSRGMR